MLSDSGAKCDSCDTKETTLNLSFADIIRRIRAKGWKITKRKNGWGHYCPTCVQSYRPKPRKLRQPVKHWQDD